MSVDMEQELTFSGRTAIVTGGGAGMGNAHSMLLGARGANVIVNDVNREAAEATAAAVVAAGGSAQAVIEDASTWDGATRLVNAALDTYGRIDIVVANAAIINMTAMADMTPENVDKLFRVNAHGPFYLALAVWPHMVKQRYGRMVLISSGAATAGEPKLAHYSAAKGAVMGMVRTMALEGKPDNIHVNGLFPVAFTAMMAGSDYNDGEEERLRRILAPSLVSPAIAWLAHEACQINGELWQAGAGRVAREFIASTPGYYHPDLTIEAVRDHEAEIENRDTYFVPDRAGDLFNWIMANSVERDQSAQA